MTMENSKYNIRIWDTAGQESYRTLIRGFYKKASGVIFTYSIADGPSFGSIDRWMDEIRNNAPK
jgi:GTPase SAR1 family protein